MTKRFDYEYTPRVLYSKRPLRDSFLPHLNRAARALEFAFTENNRKNGLDITFDQFMLLVTVRENPSATQQELAAHLSRERTAVTHALSALVRAGLLEQHKSTQDARRTIHVPTAKALDIWERLGDSAWEVVTRGKGVVSEEDMTQCINTLVKIYCAYAPGQTVYRPREPKADERSE